jgi:hypothetical protein
VTADNHMSSVEGSIGVFPRRILIPVEDWNESVAILTEAGLGEHLAVPPYRPAASRV